MNFWIWNVRKFVYDNGTYLAENIQISVIIHMGGGKFVVNLRIE